MKVLILCPRFPFPLEKGDKLRIFHQLRILNARNYELYLIALTDVLPDSYAIQKVESVVQEIHVLQIPKTKRYLSVLKHLFASIPFQVAYYYNTDIQRKINSLISLIQPDHIYCQLPRMAKYLENSNLPKTIDYMDAFGVGMKRRADVVSGISKRIYLMEAHRMINFEQHIYTFFDHHTIISEQDAKLLQRDITVVPNGIDTSFFKPLHREKKYNIGFVGNMGYTPNIDAAEFLIHQIFSQLSNNYHCVLAGARPDKRVKRLASLRVTVTGWVDDVREAYASIDIFVAPLWKGTGQQNKILEAMAMGVPCITTSSVNRAIGAKDGNQILVADNPVSFVEAIEKLSNDSSLYSDIQKNALKFVNDNYSWESSVDILEECFQRKNK